jgi:hypothetical protein
MTSRAVPLTDPLEPLVIGNGDQWNRQGIRNSVVKLRLTKCEILQ